MASFSAAQLIVNISPARPLAAWISRTSNSFPVPVSPLTRIGESIRPARTAARITANIVASVVSSGCGSPKACETTQLAAAHRPEPSNSTVSI